jgi:hypothetical protein
LKESSDQPPLVQLQAHLRDKDLLLLLDNFEHVMDAAAIGTYKTIALPPQNMTVSDLMGELSQFLALPSYQLVLPFSHQIWRELTYTQMLTGTD